MRVILASQSFLRKQAMETLGIQFEVIPSHFDEKSIRDSDPHRLTEKLSIAKAQVVAQKETKAVIIGSDGFICCGGEFLEKPVDLVEAQAMLEHLSGRQFEFITGLAVYNTETEVMVSTVETCDITFRELTIPEIKDYISRYPVLKCAGAFESAGMLRFAEAICGNFNFCSGMPMNKLVEFLRINKVYM